MYGCRLYGDDVWRRPETASLRSDTDRLGASHGVVLGASRDELDVACTTFRELEQHNVIRCHLFLGARSENCEKRLLASSCLPVCEYVTTRVPLDGLS